MQLCHCCIDIVLDDSKGINWDVQSRQEAREQSIERADELYNAKY